eukprot:CAMPEP_0171894260 /NCGR_PEP_ID=MMETSP0992-20121227/46372_1 /TAXON_ID=483369 /ORGANISM="non described non described, Strain CCMP2098" /LENGTH=158 /DNA_ID=CAMNT_0012522039 /DNA_START=115 /DNA_END=590 /DNA_ORIENTATION=-
MTVDTPVRIQSTLLTSIKPQNALHPKPAAMAARAMPTLRTENPLAFCLASAGSEPAAPPPSPREPNAVPATTGAATRNATTRNATGVGGACTAAAGGARLLGTSSLDDLGAVLVGDDGDEGGDGDDGEEDDKGEEGVSRGAASGGGSAGVNVPGRGEV